MGGMADLSHQPTPHPAALRLPIPRPGDARNKVLDAAEAIVAARGVPALTLEAAAREAGVSKGGLLYHFASKEALLRGMVARMAAELHAMFDVLFAAQPSGPGRACRAFLAWGFHSPPEAQDRDLRVAAALLAAHNHDPALLDPLRVFHARLRALAEVDGVPAGVAKAIIAACDGIFMAQVFGIWQPRQDERDAIEAGLLALLSATHSSETAAAAQ
jgi:AcrR family transcriptional regulator